MKHLRLFIVPGLLLVQASLLAWGAARHSPVIDEPAHLAAGVSNWELDRFDLFKVNPPLVRMLAALPVLAAGAKTDYGSYSQGVGVRAEFAVMDDFVRVNGSRVLWLMTLARCALIPVVLLGGYICYRWARELYGDAAGIMALALWCFSPHVLAYGQVVNADAAAAALGVTAAYFFWKWLREPAWDRAIAAGMALGLAELTKTTWVMLIGLWPALCLVVRGTWSAARRVDIGRRGGIAAMPRYAPAERRWWAMPTLQAAQLGMMLALGVFCVNAAYDFEGSGTRVRDYVFVSRPLTGIDERMRGHRFGNRFAESWLGKLPVPLPKNYVEGIDLQWHDIELGKPSYLRGRWKERGWWYWYLYALAVKVPLGTWGLFLLAAGARAAGWRGWFRVRNTESLEWTAENDSGRPHPGPLPEGEGAWNYNVTWRDEIVLLAPAVVVLALVSSQTGFSRYIRYILPIFPFVFIWIGGATKLIDSRRLVATWRRLGHFVKPLVSLAKGGRAAKESGDESPHSMLLGIAAVLLLAWSVASSLWYAPHWMSYFNELAGGPLGGPAHLIDAQVDWGQDLLYLKQWLAAHPDARPLGLVYFGPINPTIADINFDVPPKGTLLGKERSEVSHPPNELKPGWYAVSVNFLHGYPHFIESPHGAREWLSRPCYSYFRRFQPVATAGYSIYIYHLTAEMIDAEMRAEARES